MATHLARWIRLWKKTDWRTDDKDIWGRDRWMKWAQSMTVCVPWERFAKHFRCGGRTICPENVTNLLPQPLLYLPNGHKNKEVHGSRKWAPQRELPLTNDDLATSLAGRQSARSSKQLRASDAEDSRWAQQLTWQQAVFAELVYDGEGRIAPLKETLIPFHCYLHLFHPPCSYNNKHHNPQIYQIPFELLCYHTRHRM